MNTPLAETLFVQLQAFVLGLLPLDMDHVIQGLGNGAAMPDGDFVCMTATTQRRLSTNSDTYDTDADTRTVLTPTEYSIQVDCYGPNSSDMASTLCMMWRDEYGCDAMVPSAPLYAADPVQVPLVNAEKNYEQRWTFIVLLQFNPTVTVLQQFAETLIVDTQPPL